MSIPSHYLTTTVDLAPVQSLRKALASQGTKISVNDCIVRAAALALADVPAANSFWDANAGEAVAQKGVDVAVAVATPGGLLTPVVTNADGKGLLKINREVADLAGRARANKLKPEEFTGGWGFGGVHGWVRFWRSLQVGGVLEEFTGGWGLEGVHR